MKEEKEEDVKEKKKEMSFVSLVYNHLTPLYRTYFWFKKKWKWNAM